MTPASPSVRLELPLRHRDMDVLGHLNQAVYHVLLEEVRSLFVATVLPELPFTGYVLARSELDYRHEVRREAGFVIGECEVAGLGRSRVELANRLRLPDETLAAEGRATLVAWDPDVRRSRALTPEERERLLPGGAEA